MTTQQLTIPAPSAPVVERNTPNIAGYCQPGAHVWTIHPGQTYPTCFWCSVIRT